MNSWAYATDARGEWITRISRTYPFPDTPRQQARAFSGGMRTHSAQSPSSVGRPDHAHLREPVPRRSRTARVVGAALLPLVLLASLGVFAVAVRGAIAPEAPALPIVDLLPGGGLDESDGVIPDDRTVTVHEDELPAMTNLDPQLLDALRAAADDAAEDGVSFQVNSAWRSPDLQKSLLEDAIERYGSREEAARWVASPETSSHVRGEAIDLGPVDATSWLSQHGAEHGLCQIYANEPWHYELRPEAVENGCPEQFLDPTHDPRLQS